MKGELQGSAKYPGILLLPYFVTCSKWRVNILMLPPKYLKCSMCSIYYIKVATTTSPDHTVPEKIDLNESQNSRSNSRNLTIFPYPTGKFKDVPMGEWEEKGFQTYSSTLISGKGCWGDWLSGAFTGKANSQLAKFQISFFLFICLSILKIFSIVGKIRFSKIKEFQK